MEEVKHDRRACRIGFELMELKTIDSHHEFIIKNTVHNRILGWGALPSVDNFQAYLKEHKFPKDSLYSEKQFLDDVEGSEGYIHLKVKKEETAKFICEMIYQVYEI